MSSPSFKLLYDSRSQYLPPFKIRDKTGPVSVSPDESTIDNISLSIEQSEAFVSKCTLTPITKDLSGDIKQSISYLTRTSEIRWHQYHPTRAGIIPYYKTGSNIYFCLGEDSVSKQLGDFGGGIEFSETSLDGALREFQEESLGVFGTVTKAELRERIAVTSKRMIIIFLPVILSPQIYGTRFDNAKKDRETLEISNIYWLTQHQLQGLIADAYPQGHIKIYYKVKMLLAAVFAKLVKLL